jgi:serine/threonine protein kinase
MVVVVVVVVLLVLLMFLSFCRFRHLPRLGPDGRYQILRMLGRGGFSEVYKVLALSLSLSLPFSLSPQHHTTLPGVRFVRACASSVQSASSEQRVERGEARELHQTRVARVQHPEIVVARAHCAAERRV